MANYRCHRKITVIDGKIGYLGGMNLTGEQMPGVAWPTWRDTQVRAHGQAAQALQIAPFHRGDNSKVEQLPDKLPYFDLDGEQIDLLPVQIIMSGPDSQWHGIRQLYFHLITSARKHVYIQSPFFIPDETIAGSYARRSAGRRRRAPDLHAPLATSTRFHTGGQHLFRRPGRGRVKTHLYDDGYYHAKTVNMDSQVCPSAPATWTSAATTSTMS
ncbi:MAG: hypothetical protein R2851_27955 [Caldilineaceae bacterium]